MKNLNRNINCYKIDLEPFDLNMYGNVCGCSIEEFITNLDLKKEVTITSTSDNEHRLLPLLNEDNYLFGRFSKKSNLNDNPQTILYCNDEPEDNKEKYDIENFSYFLIDYKNLFVVSMTGKDIPKCNNLLVNWLNSNIKEYYKSICIVPYITKDISKAISTNSLLQSVDIKYVDEDVHSGMDPTYKELEETLSGKIKSQNTTIVFEKNTKTTSVKNFIKQLKNKCQGAKELKVSFASSDDIHKQVVDLINNTITKKIPIVIDEDEIFDEDKIFNLLKENLNTIID